jgi:Holliday junction resolvasome RuvABC endonuclease subunit
LLILERGFSRYNITTQQLFRVHGIINLLFKDIPQLYYAPTTIKKGICGTGKAKKEEIYKAIKELYPNILCKNDDESDSLAIMHYYINYIEKGKDNG